MTFMDGWNLKFNQNRLDLNKDSHKINYNFKYELKNAYYH